MSDEPGYSPDDLKRMGLAGRGDLSRLRVWFGDFAPFARALCPTWRGVILTVLLAWALSWLGYGLAWARYPIPGIEPGMFPPVEFGKEVVALFANRIEHPLDHLAWRGSQAWSTGMSALGPLFAIGTGIVLLRSAGGSVRRLWIGGVIAAAGLAGVGWAVIGRHEPGSLEFTMVALNGVVALAGAVVAAWLLIRATGLASSGSTFVGAVSALLAAALLTVNVGLVFSFPIEGFAQLLGTRPDLMAGGQAPPGFYWMLSRISTYTVSILGWALIFVPAFIILRGLGLRAALRLLGRLAKRRTALLVATYVGLALVALLPVGGLLRVVFMSTGLIEIQPGVFPGSLLASLCDGIQMGLFLYATALAACALADLDS